MKKSAFIILLLLGNSAYAKIDLFTNCQLMTLASSCNIGRDMKSPKFMRLGGPAACFVGLELAKKHDLERDAPFENIIKTENYKKAEHAEKINEIVRCTRDIHTIQNCDLGFVRASGLKSIKSCNDLINSNKPIITKSPNSLESNVFTFNLSKDWKLTNERIGKDNIKYYFQNDKNDLIQLTVSDTMSADQLKQGKQILKNGIKKIWQPKNMELIKHTVVNIGPNKQINEQIGRNLEMNHTVAMYYLYGKDRMAILSLSLKDSDIEITSLSHNIAEAFNWIQ